MYALLAIFSCMAFYCLIKIDSILIKQSQNYDMHLVYYRASACFRDGTDILTEAVRQYVATTKVEYANAYFVEANIERHRDLALSMIKDLKIEKSLKNDLKYAMRNSVLLMDIEYHAMHLLLLGKDELATYDAVKAYPLSEEERNMSLEERHALAFSLLWDESYVKTKNYIYSYLDSGIENASEFAMQCHMKLKKEFFVTMAIGSLSLICILLTIFGFVLYRRSQHERMVEEQARDMSIINFQLKQERDKSIKAEKAKSYFFSTVSHDIRTPLNAIIGFSEMLQLGIDDPEEKKKALDAIITSGHTLLELINDVLDLSKLEAGKMELHPAPTNVATLVTKVATSFEAAISRTSLSLHTQVHKMPYLKLDPQRIRQILFNLIGNAVKYTSNGSITISASYVNGTFTLSVKDTGCGISEENIKKLMSPYVQLQAHDSTQGTGLGLAICKQLSTQMNGTLGIESTVGKGTTFTLTVPNVVAFSDKESEEYSKEFNMPHITAQLVGDITQKNILVVDDQKLNQAILKSMLGRLGLTKVMTAANGLEAIEKMRASGNIDIVLTDMSMPVLDGEGLVREIRKSPEFDRVPIYVITADVEMQTRYKEKGFDDMLLKPITLEKLNNLLVHCTSGLNKSL